MDKSICETITGKIELPCECRIQSGEVFTYRQELLHLKEKVAWYLECAELKTYSLQWSQINEDGFVSVLSISDHAEQSLRGSLCT